MKKPRNLSFLFLSVGIVSALSASGTLGSDKGNWPMFRGPRATGIADGHAAPESWNTEEGRNVKWKTAVPGLGFSCPIIWGDRIYVTTAISGMVDPYLKVGLYGNIDPVKDESEHLWKMICLDKHSGEVVWDRDLLKAVPRIKRHTKSSHSNSTPATDGRYIVTFLGSEGLFCYDMDGEEQWRVDLGKLDAGYFRVPAAQWGFGSSPVIYGDRVYVQCDVQEGSFVGAFDLKTGKEVWRTDRNDVPTWGTPALSTSEPQQLVVNGWKHIGGYDLNTGKEIWKMSGGGDIPVPTPIIWENHAFIANAHGGQAPLYAIKLSAVGDISLAPDQHSNEYISWSVPRNGAYMQTPIIYGDLIYSCRNNGTLKCYDARTGELIYQQRLGTGRTGFTASPVAADGKLYFTAEDGDVYVVKAGSKFELLATNSMNEVCMATPALSEGVLYLRTQHHLVAIVE